MSGLLTLRAAVVAGIKTLLPAVKTVKEYDGQFDGEELARHSLAAPAVLVAIAGVPQAELSSDGTLCTVRLVAFVLTRETAGISRGAAALANVNTLLHGVQEQTWGLSGVDTPKAVRGDSLYDRKIDQTGTALWGVAWEQNVTLGAVDPAVLDVFKTFAAGYDLAPEDGAIAATDKLTELDR
jgi:phage gp37-like protein